MDNLAHTLAGLALAEAGLRRRSALATATLVIGANLPDVDALIYLVGSGVDALAFRRGWTHGVLAMAALPLLLTGAMLAWDRAVRRRRGSATPVRPLPLLLVAAIGIWSHPLLDLLNTYGVRLLMPFSDRWFYGDALFIVDPWLWLVLAAGILFARWLRRAGVDDAGHGRAERPARIAIGAAVLYAGAMAASSRAGALVVERARSPAAARVLVSPVPVTPFRRTVLRDLGGRYELGALRWTPGASYQSRTAVDVGRDRPGVAEASRTPEGAAFLTWSRFPRFETRQVGDSIHVRLVDARYADERGRGWATALVVVPAPEHLLPPESP